MYNDHLKTAFFKDVQKYPLLGVVEERSLLKLARGGDTKALHKLVCCNQRFIIKVATMFQGQGMDLLDLVNEGNCGLINAVGKYNLKSKIRFLSYAVWWIRQSIIKAIYEKVRIIKLPFNRAGLLYKYRRLTLSNLTNKQLMSRLQITAKELDELKVLDADICSVEMLLPGLENQRALGDMIADTRTNFEKDVAEKYLCKYIEKELLKLDDTDAFILEKYFGLKEVPYTLEQIAQMLGVSKERIRQRKAKALRRLRVFMYNLAKEDDLC